MTWRWRLRVFWGTDASLARYRVMAMIVGTGLATLCFIGIPLQLIGDIKYHLPLFHNKWPWASVVEIVGTAHGFFYIIYLVTCLDLAARARFRTVQLLGMVGAGLLPGLAFYMEHRVTERVKAQLALGELAPPGPVASLWAVLLRRPGRRVGQPRPSGTDLDGPSLEDRAPGP